MSGQKPVAQTHTQAPEQVRRHGIGENHHTLPPATTLIPTTKIHHHEIVPDLAAAELCTPLARSCFQPPVSRLLTQDQRPPAFLSPGKGQNRYQCQQQENLLKQRQACCEDCTRCCRMQEENQEKKKT